jgi:hypothetical protein
MYTAAACTLFQDCVEKLATDDTGEILLQPIAHAPELVRNTSVQKGTALNAMSRLRWMN